MDTTSRKRLLVIDDEENLVKVVSRAMSDHGYEVLTAIDPLKGIDLAREHNPAVVLTDTVMPLVDGTHVAREILRLGKVTQVIMMTGFVEPIRVLDAYAIGVSDYLLKPFSVDDLVSTVGRAQDRYERWRKLVLLASKARKRDLQPEAS